MGFEQKIPPKETSPLRAVLSGENFLSFWREISLLKGRKIYSLFSMKF